MTEKPKPFASDFILPEYHQEDVSLYWKSDEVVVINDVELNVLTDKYDWRTD